MDGFLSLVAACWGLFAEMAPYLLLGFTIAGILSVVLTPAWVQRHLGGRGILQVIKAAVFGVPLPLCSCGVIPVAASLRRHGASRGATAAFLLSTPQTGVDSILATYGLIGGALGAVQGFVFVVVRVVMSLFSGIVGGTVITRICDPDEGAPPSDLGVMGAGEPEAKSAASLTVCGTEGPCGDSPASCCASDGAGGGAPTVPPKASAPRGMKALVAHVVRYAYVILPRDIARPLLVGILIAGLISTVLSPGVLSPYLDGGIFAMLAMMVVGIPLYVCATASLPLAIGFMHMGASPGAALVFLIAGPATNAATLTTIYRLLGGRSLFLYLMTIVVSSLLAGLGTDATFAWLDLATTVQPLQLYAGEGLGAVLRHGAAVVLLLMLVWGFLRSWRRPPARGADEAVGEADLEIAVRGMTCDHCAQTVRAVVARIEGVRAVEVDRSRERVWITGNALEATPFLEAIRQAGYEAEVCTATEPASGSCACGADGCAAPPPPVSDAK